MTKLLKCFCPANFFSDLFERWENSSSFDFQRWICAVGKPNVLECAMGFRVRHNVFGLAVGRVFEKLSARNQKFIFDLKIHINSLRPIAFCQAGTIAKLQVKLRMSYQSPRLPPNHLLAEVLFLFFVFYFLAKWYSNTAK